ncbi:bifunctional helix-turn-helix transcriptional regulator/GNAT family N-acetyltransferase [Nocardia transvalensis]|uniref:bifunctional helix-turn-helix transcriptional regulator/GNAT family N-acetyltransferase n=1 Tax=Nocardia transvalensis TaxID=37333 RepID=UPI001892F094|nr:helix-turn-helix domain-containing GNAT family N-acetyltransferase [Nocardia transvalensis]MBF6330103.1 MarR family transcriptional regulator [Nocardia transvalensis]
MTAVTDPDVDAEHVAAVREFNRRYTRLIGVLQEHLVDSDFSLTEARILFELAHFGPLEVVTLRQNLDLDPGYLSRILSRFEEAGLVLRQRSEHDGRRQLVQLTDLGRGVFTDLDGRSSRAVATLLGGHPPTARHRLVNAMHTIERILDGRAAAEFTIRDPRPGDYGWVVQSHAALYAAEYGWDISYEALVARIVADYLETREPHTERAWIAERDGEPIGSVFCVREDDTTARLRLLLVEPSARGLGVGSALVGECLRFATDAGYRSMVLWTNDVLTAARRIYERAGFELIESEPHHSFGKDLVGQTWRRSLV